MYDKTKKAMQEQNILVKEYDTFEAAWEAAFVTRTMYDSFQGMKQKIDYIKKSSRWFVTDDGELYYSYVLPTEGIRCIHKAEVHSMLSNSPFQYVQIMVVHNKEINPEQNGRLRFSGTFVSRADAAKISAEGEVFAFNK